MELGDYFRIIRRRGWLIILLALLTAFAAYGFSRMQPTIYKSTARLLITSRPDFGQSQATRFLLRDFAAYMNSSLRAEQVIANEGLDMTPGELLSNVTIAASTDSNMIQVDVKNTNGDVANDIARAWGDLLIQWRNDENSGLRKEDRIEAQLLDNPQYGLDSPKTRINSVAGGVFGALLGVILIVLLEWFDSGIVRRPEDVERYLDVPVVGTIPK